MAILDVGRIKDLLLLNKYQDEWILESKIIVSPFGDFMVIASESCAVFLIKKYNPTPEFQICRTYKPSPFELSPDASIDCGLITAVFYLPVKIEQQGRSHDLLHCVVLGYSSGLIEFVSGSSGQVLAQKLPLEKPVVKFKALSGVSSEAHHLSSFALVQNLLELLVVYETCIVAITGPNLFSTLMKNRRELGTNCNEGTPKPSRLSKFSCKKMLINDQVLTDVSGIVIQNFQLFDQLSYISMNKELIHEDQMRNASSIIKYISVGSSTFVVTSTSQRFGPPKVKELAENVVSTVKSKIFGMASGFIWGSTSPAGKSDAGADEGTTIDQEIKLQMLHAFKDKSKTAVCIETSPNGRYSAILDSHHRVLIQDNTTGSVIHILKGYHHAQMGWITTSWEGKKDAPERLPTTGQEFALLLILYLPRRGILEIWSPEQMSRIIEFPVGKTGRLIHSSETVLDSSARSNVLARTFECSYLSTSGAIQRIYIPVHTLSSRSTSHDRTLLKQMKTILADERSIEDKLNKITDLIMASKDVSAKLLMVLDLFQSGSCSSSDCRKILETLGNQLAECPAGKRHCDRLKRALDLYDFLSSQPDDDSLMSEMNESIDIYNLRIFLEEFKDLRDIFKANESYEAEDFSLSEFSSCFQLGRLVDKREITEKVGSETSIDSLCIVESKTPNARSMLKFFSFLATKASQDFDMAKTTLIEAKIEGNLLESALSCLVAANANELEHIHSNQMVSLFRLLFELCAGENFIPGTLNAARKFLLKSQLGPSSVVVIISWQNYVSSFHSATLASEWTSVLKNIGAYLTMNDWFKSIKSNLFSDETFGLVHRYDEVFLNGNGRISELIADWIFASRESINSEPIEKFLVNCRQFFLLSCRREIITVHLAWKYLQVWSKNHADLKLLNKAFDCLMALKNISKRRRLASLIWSTFFSKATKDVISVTEIRSASRCERELGMPESQLANFLNLCVQILLILINNSNNFDSTDEDEDVEDPDDGKRRTNYDIIPGSSVNVDHVMDIVQKLPLFDSDVVSVQYQFLFVANAIWSFGLVDFKPLSLFNSQESNAFFQNPSSLSPSLRLFGREHGRSVRNGRRKFLEQVLDAAVAEIHHTTSTMDGVDFGSYQIWCRKLRMLAEMWNMNEKFTEYQIISLYRAGHDAVGDEIFSTISEDERKSVGLQLLRVCLMRLASFLQFEDGRYQRIKSTHPDLAAKITALKREACGCNGVAEVPMKFTSDLLINITKLDIDQDNLHVAYECLTIVQMVRKD